MVARGLLRPEQHVSDVRVGSSIRNQAVCFETFHARPHLIHIAFAPIAVTF